MTFHGGSFDGSTLKVDLAKDGDQWKLDKITDIPTFNFPGMVQAFAARLRPAERAGAGTILATCPKRSQWRSASTRSSTCSRA